MNETRQTLTVSEMRLDSFHPEKMEEAACQSSITHMQLGRGRFTGDLIRARCSQGILDSGKYNLPLLAVGEMPGEHITLAFILEARGEGTLNGCTVRANAPVIFTEGSEIHYRLAPGTHWIALQITRELLEQNGTILPRHLSAVLDADRATSLRLARVFGQAVQTLRQSSDQDQRVLDARRLGLSIQECILAEFCGALFPAKHAAAKTRTRKVHNAQLVSQAVRYFESHFAEPIEISSVCDLTGVSWRTVQRAFMGAYGMSPKSFLTALRLSRARKELLSSARLLDPVSRIALECGFFHLGRFSGDYLELYGELPSDTRKRVAGR